MRLKELIDTLERMPADAEVRFDFGHPAGELASWRGRYNELTLTWGQEPRSVAVVLADAKAAVGKTFSGYKGGDYVMSESTPVWGDDWGDCNSHGILGASVKDGVVELTTADLSDYS